jgi:hypothetical protein
MRGMNRKNILAVSIAAALPLSIANHVGYQGHCEIKPEQCLQNAPDQLHTEHRAHASVSNGSSSNTTITPGSGSLSLSADASAVATATGDLTTGSAAIVEGADIVAGVGNRLPNDGMTDFLMNQQDDYIAAEQLHAGMQVSDSAPVIENAPRV